MQRAIRHAPIHHLRNMRNHDYAVKQHASNNRLCQEVDRSARTITGKNEIVKPLRCCNQHQRWHEV